MIYKEDMDISTSKDTPENILQAVFGYTTFRPLQREIIDRTLANQDSFVLMPTGGGKSLCFQIPAIIKSGVMIVVSPLISLMQDQVNSLRNNGVAAAYYNSSLSSEESRQVLAKLHQDELDLLYIAPERLVTESFLQRLQDINIAGFAIDEAHCVSQWGHDFRPEYVQLNCLKQYFPECPIIALTATADKQTRQDICFQLSLQHAKIFIASFNRPNIRYTIIDKYKPLDQLLHFLKSHEDDVGIVYCTSRKRVEEVAQRLQNRGFSARAYHAGLGNSERKKVLEAFQNDDVQIVVATVAFGMGIDKSNVRYIVHYDMPKHLESYYQETGRAGRDGLPAEVLMLFGVGDIPRLKALIEQNQNDEQRRIELHKLNAMAGFAEAQQCRRRVLLNYFAEDLTEDCGNCDICLNPAEKYDATRDAQIALSCVYRVKQSFGIAHVIDVLMGSEKQKIKQFHHDQLSTFGIGKHLTSKAWYSVFRQLIHLGYLEQDLARFSVLKLTQKARAVLKGEIVLQLAKPRIDIEKIKPTKSTKAKTVVDLDFDKKLFERLRQLRKQLADKQNVPPFVIFADSALVEMAAKLPNDNEEFLAITGVGEIKLKRYGQVFMDVIGDYLAEES